MINIVRGNVSPKNPEKYFDDVIQERDDISEELIHQLCNAWHVGDSITINQVVVVHIMAAIEAERKRFSHHLVQPGDGSVQISWSGSCEWPLINRLHCLDGTNQHINNDGISDGPLLYGEFDLEGFLVEEGMDRSNAERQELAGALRRIAMRIDALPEE